MTPSEFVEVMQEMHEPYVPRLVGVIHTDPTHPHYNSGEWHEPTLEEKADALLLWCDGCNCPAAKCRVKGFLDFVESEESCVITIPFLSPMAISLNRTDLLILSVSSLCLSLAYRLWRSVGRGT